MNNVNFTGPEWLAIKEVLNDELNTCVKMLINPTLTEGEYQQWRGRAALVNKLLGLETTPKHVTE